MLGGVERDVQLDLTPEVTVGDYVLVHAGFAIQRMDEAEAKETLALLAKIDPDFPIGTGENGA